MRRIHPLTWLSLFTCIAILGICILIGTNQNSGSVQASSPPTNQTLAPGSETGMPAITPGSKNSTGATYGSADAAQYVRSHHIPRTFSPSTKPIVDTVRFLTSQEVSQLFNGEPLGVPDGTLVCMVEFHGTFLTLGPNGKTGTFQNGAEVFDAQTGNLLLVRLWP